MVNWRESLFWFVGGVLLLTSVGCVSPDVNPTSARTGRGYADLFTQPKDDVWWRVEIYDAQNEGYKEFTAQFENPGSSIFRVEARPGKHKARIAFVNRTAVRPAEIEVEIRDGMITPIRITMEPAGEPEVHVREDRAAWYRSRVQHYWQQMWKISASVESPVPYRLKQSMTYW